MPRDSPWTPLPRDHHEKLQLCCCLHLMNSMEGYYVQGSELGTGDTVEIRHGPRHQRAYTPLQICVLPRHLCPKPVAGSVPVLGHGRSQCGRSRCPRSYCCKVGYGWLCLRPSKSCSASGKTPSVTVLQHVGAVVNQRAGNRRAE